MEELRDTLTFNDAQIEDWTFDRTEKDGLKMRFTLTANLTKELAAYLRCASIYEADTGKIDLLHKLKDTELLLPTPGVPDAVSSFFPDVMYKFKASKDDNRYSIACAVHVSGRVDELHEIFKAYEAGVTITVKPRQGELFDGGTRVAMSDGTQQNGGPVLVVDNAQTQEQQMLDEGCPHDPPTETPASTEGPVIASAREAGGKTPGRRGRRRAGIETREEQAAAVKTMDVADEVPNVTVN